MRLGCLLALLLLSACSATRPVRVLQDERILVDTVWDGALVIDGAVHVAKGVTLTIRPGTDIAFVRHDRDADGLGDGTLVIEGRLIAEGTRSAPIRFHSAEAEPKPGDWLEIRVDFSKEVLLRYCEIRDSAYTLHAHFTRGLMADSHIHDNIDGCRLGEATFTFRNNLFENNQGKGINFRNATVEVEHNIIRYNGSGIFLFETDRVTNIHHNNIYDNGNNIRLGDFFTGTVSVRDNWWGSADPKVIALGIHDRRVDPLIGTVQVAPAKVWVSRSGVRDAFDLQEVWRLPTDGFVDAGVQRIEEYYVIASWDGKLRAITMEGQPVWSVDLEDVIDATPAWDGTRLYVQTWGRDAFALDANGQIQWRFSTSPSPADDHRQAALLPVNGKVLLPSWNGRLYALDAKSGERLWQFDAGEALRATPAFDVDRVYLAGSGGTLTALSLDGDVLWQAHLDAPLLSTPAVTGNGVAVVSRAGDIFFFDRSGRRLWHRALKELCHYSAPLYRDGALFVGTSGGSLWKLRSTDGLPVWNQTGFGPIYATPALVDRRLYLGDNDGALSVVDADSGTVVSRFRVDGEVQGTPWLEGDRVLVGTRDRNVYALRRVAQAVSP
jgi:outer membrane protein assembly factor BamB